jgi:hypothetical protein
VGDGGTLCQSIQVHHAAKIGRNDRIGIQVAKSSELFLADSCTDRWMIDAESAAKAAALFRVSRFQNIDPWELMQQRLQRAGSRRLP